MNDAVETNEVQHLFLVRINYKSGNSFEGWFSKFDTKARGAQIESVTWKLAPNSRQQLIHVGVDDIESIVQLDYKEAN